MKVFSLVVLACLLIGCNASRPDVQSTPTPLTPPATTPPAEVKPTATVLTGDPLKDAGIPHYPGAKVKGTASTPGSEGESRFTVLLSTLDSEKKVSKFYQDELKVEPNVKDGTTAFVGRTQADANVIVEIIREADETKITIRAIVYDKPQPK